MLDEFIEALHEEFLEALHSVFRKAVNSRDADKQHWFAVFWLMVKIGRQAGLHLPLPTEECEPPLSQTSFLL